MGGEPFGEPLSHRLEREDGPRLVEEHLAALERRADLDLAAGCAEQLVPELLTLTERFRIREPLWARLLQALHEAGRTAEALQAYDQVRTLLADELGTDPGAELQQLHRELLAVPPPSPPGPDLATTAATPPRRTLRQLPRPPGRFPGRGAELDRLDRLLTAGDQTGLIVLHGPSGVGKTALALRWANSVTEQFPDGQLFVDLHGFDEHTVLPQTALESLLRSFGIAAEQLPGREQDAAMLLRSTMADKRCLLVLDNALDDTQVRPLLPGGESLVLVTSRSQMRSITAREAAQRISVEVLPPPDAVAMLAARVERPVVDTVELAELAELCGRLPVALAVVAEQAAREPGTLTDLIVRLRDEAGRLDQLSIGDDPLTDVRAAFEGSYALLDDDCARTFRLLGLHPDTAVHLEAVAALLGTDLSVARRLLDQLTDWHFIAAQEGGWYDLHDLVRMFSRDRLAVHEPAESAAAAQRRLRAWYAHATFAATYTGNETVLVGPPELPDGVTPWEASDNAAAMEWLAEHRPIISRLLRTAAADGDGAIASRLAIDFAQYLGYIWADSEEREICRIGVAAARAVGAKRHEAVCLNNLGVRLASDEEYEEAIECFLRGVELFASIDERVGEHRLAANAAVVHSMAGEVEKAEQLLIQQLDDLEQGSLDEETAATLVQLADVQLALDRPRDAIESATTALGLLDPEVDQTRMAMALDKIGKGAGAIGDVEEAARALNRCAAAYEEVGDLNEAFNALEQLASVQRTHGRLADARRNWSAALALLDQVDPATVAERRERLQTLLAESDRDVS